MPGTRGRAADDASKNVGQPKAGAWYRFAVCIIKPVLLLLTRRDWRGTDNLPRKGGVIVAANHIAHVDPFTIAHVMHDHGRFVRFLAKAELFKIFFIRSVLRGTHQIPVHRRTADAALALRDAVTALENGECVVVYPEGTTTKDPTYWPMAGKTGIARLALMTGAPVIPLAQWGPQHIFDRDLKLHLFPRHTITMSLGPPVDLSAYVGRAPTADVLRGVTDAVMHDIRALLGEIRGEAPPTTVFQPPQQAKPPADERQSA